MERRSLFKGDGNGNMLAFTVGGATVLMTPGRRARGGAVPAPKGPEAETSGDEARRWCRGRAARGVAH